MNTCMYVIGKLQLNIGKNDILKQHAFHLISLKTFSTVHHFIFSAIENTSAHFEGIHIGGLHY